MKKFVILILICLAQNTFSQNTKTDSKKKNSTTKGAEPVIVNEVSSDSYLIVDEAPRSVTAVINDENVVYNTAGIEVKPNFPGGIEKFYAFVDSNFKNPETDADLKGKKIYITFIVEKDGTLTDIKILRDAGYGTGAEAIRVLKKCPKWNPGEQNGKKVRVLYSLPITIK